MLVFLYLCSLCLVVEAAQVTTADGVSVIGSKASDGNYLSFHNVKYATADGKRFEGPSPQLKREEETTLDRKIICAHPTTEGLIGEEDCLTLDIFTKNVSSSSPIIVWLNHEEFPRESPHSFRSLIEAGTVVIAVNYRLSVFGFLCLKISEAPGNAGLKDVIQALKWIQRNAAGFGGDPTNVMLLGYQSGAVVVDLVTMSPLSANLVHKAIAIGGSALARSAVDTDPLGNAEALGAAVGFSGDSSQELAHYLAELDMYELADAVDNNTITFAPCVENRRLPGFVLRHKPSHVLQSGEYRHIPYIAGYEAEKEINPGWTEMYENMIKEASKDWYAYVHDESTHKRSLIEGFIEYKENTSSILPVTKGAKQRAATASESRPVYLLSFDFHEAENNILDYILDRKQANQLAKTTLISRIVAFAYTGKPNLKKGIVWKPVSSEKVLVLKISGYDRGQNNTSARQASGSSFKESLGYGPYDNILNYWKNIRQFEDSQINTIAWIVVATLLLIPVFIVLVMLVCANYRISTGVF